MNMSYSVNCADVVSWDAIQEICPAASAAISDAIQEHGIELDEFIRILHDGDDKEEEKFNRLSKLFDQLEHDFREATRVGDSVLMLYPVYHDPDNGGWCDDIPGGAFEVEGVYQLSPAGQKITDNIKRQFYVVFG